MITLFRKIFNRKKDNLFSIPDNPDFENSIEFSKPHEGIFKSLADCLKLLEERNGGFFLDKSLKSKKVNKYLDIQKLTEKIKSDLEFDFEDITKEFEGEPLGVTYYLGTDILYTESVEIVKKIYHKERKDIGNILHSLVVKYKEGYFYYWQW